MNNFIKINQLTYMRNNSSSYLAMEIFKVKNGSFWNCQKFLILMKMWKFQFKKWPIFAKLKHKNN